MIESTRVRLRPLEREHCANTLIWVNDPELSVLLNRARPVSQEEHETWFRSLSGRDDCQYFAIELVGQDRHVGNVWLWAVDRRHQRAEVRILIGDLTETNKGVGTEALQLISRYAFDCLNIHRLYAFVLALNPRARRSFEKAGYREEGLLRADRWSNDRYVDVHLLSRLREDPAEGVP